MAVAVVTTVFRKKLLKARAGDLTLPTIQKIAFGNGGVDNADNVIQPLPTQTALNNELLRKNVASHTYLNNDTACRYTCTLSNSELVGVAISEIGIVDSAGDIIAIKNFSPKVKDGDIELVFNIDDII